MRTLETRPAVAPAAAAHHARQRPAASAATHWLLGAIVLLALGLRLYHLGNRPLWLDETYTAQAVRFHTLGEVIAWSYASLDQMPVFNVITWLLRGLGAQEWSLRLPSVVAGTLSVPAIYALGASLGRPRVGLIAALLMATLPFSVWYGQEGRPYALLMLAATLQVLFAYRAVTRAHPGDWCGLILFTVLTLYTHYLGLFMAAVVAAFISLALLVEFLDLARRPGREGAALRQRWRRLGAQIGAALVAGAITAAAYAPWLPATKAFLRRDQSGDRGFGQFSTTYQATLANLQHLLAQFGFYDLVLALLCLGLVTALVWLARRQWRAGLLLLLWLAIPVSAFWLRLHGGIVTVSPRYLSVLFPVGVLLAALGAGTLVELATRAWRYAAAGRRSGFVAATASSVIALLLLGQTVPALASQYALPKTDYRGATDYILAHSPASAVVFAIGTCNDFMLGPVDYYLWRHHSPIIVVDGAQVDDRVAARLRQGTGRAWAAVITGSASSGCSVPADLTRVSTAGLAVTPFTEISVLRVRDPQASPLAQARTLLRWGSALQPQTLASLDLLDVLSRGTALGPNLLPAPTQATTAHVPERWALTPGTSLTPDRRAFDLAPTGGMVNVTLTTRRVTAGSSYLLSFHYRNAALRGEQKVYVSALDDAGHWLDIFPNGAGYSCAPAATWTHGTFALTPPRGTTALIVWLRASGSGAAQFTDVALQKVD